MIKKITTFIIATALVIGCSTTPNSETKKTIFVTISPLKSLVEGVTCGDYNIEVLVPDGASPETYEPTAKQLIQLNNAEHIYSTGLITFEKTLLSNITRKELVTELSNGIELIEGSCSHGHHHHSHGVDPHIWTSPRALKTMVKTICEITMAQHLDSTKYIAASDKLICKINALDKLCDSMITENNVELLMVYHPAYTYYARDYDIEQIAIEHDGKEPSPRQLATLIEQARQHNIKAILIQPQYSKDKVQAIASECGAEVIEINPLATDILSEIERVTNIICNGNE